MQDGLNENKILWKFYVSSQIRAEMHLMSVQINFFTKVLVSQQSETSFDYKFMRNCWRWWRKIVLCHFPSFFPQQLLLLSKWANERKCLLFERDKHEPSGMEISLPLCEIIVPSLFNDQTEKLMMKQELRLKQIKFTLNRDVIQWNIKPFVSLARRYVSSTHFLTEMQSSWN